MDWRSRPACINFSPRSSAHTGAERTILSAFRDLEVVCATYLTSECSSQHWVDGYWVAESGRGCVKDRWGLGCVGAESGLGL